MSDPAIKLFGKTIPLPEVGGYSCSRYTEDLTRNHVRLSDSYTGDDEEMGDSGLGGGGGGESESEKEEKDNECLEESSSEVATSTSGITETAKAMKKTNETTGGAAATATATATATACSQETKLKKPDKILPCPRCNSMETKFCYYNNYNVNQPRHFCKKCQRYWTAGGTMRNVPVGAGRRKNKNLASHYNRHLTITSPEALHKAAPPNGANLLTFGSDSLLCESMASGLNLADKIQPEPNQGLKITVPPPPNEEAGTISPTPKVPCFPGPPTWPYAWNGVSWTVLPFYPPPPYWTCPPGTWNSFAWMPQPNSPSGSGPNSPTLGKHSRDETALEETEKSKPERCLWVPKTLRIDHPEEAAKSSIWETLGIKKEETFGAFRSSNKDKNSVRRPELQANPAALSRSANFHESS